MTHTAAIYSLRGKHLINYISKLNNDIQQSPHLTKVTKQFIMCFWMKMKRDITNYRSNCIREDAKAIAQIADALSIFVEMPK